MNAHARILLVACFVGLASAAVACKRTELNPDHCVNQAGDAWCAEHFGGDRPFCILEACVEGPLPERGCVMEQPSNECWSPCGGSSLADDPTCEGVASLTDTESASTTMGPASDPSTSATMPSTTSMTTTDETTTEPETTDTGPVGCEGPGDCDEDTPFCENNLCVACDQVTEADDACEKANAATPLCVEGTCVACTEDTIGACGGTTPICDADANTCVGCRFHEECQEMEMPACHIAEGSCIAAFTEVDAGMPNSIQNAIDDVVDDTPHAIVITNGGGQQHRITIDGGQIIALLSDPDAADPHDVFGAPGNPTLTVTGAGTVAYLHRVRLLGNTDSVGVAVASSGTLYADSTQIVQNTGGGITLGSSTTASLRNCMIGVNGSQFAGTTGVRATNATLDILYTSIGANDGMGADSLQCDAGSAVTVRNSILVGSDDESAACASIDATFSAFDQVVAGMGNVDVGMLDPGWFPGIAAGDLSLSGSGDAEFADVAVWSLGDPPFDYDGDPRPTADGDPDYAGADVP